MGKIFFLFGNLFLLSNILISQINPRILILYATNSSATYLCKNSREVAYGLAWAHAEDDFKTIQIGYLAGNNFVKILWK